MRIENNFGKHGRAIDRFAFDERDTKTPINKRGQVTLFIIIAIIIVGGVILYYTVGRSSVSGVSEEMRPVYDYYLSCVEEKVRQGINLLGEQGGYIKTPEFEPGSAYMPFSSHLSFFGQGVPYWMYVSGNNLLRENVPTKEGMERELSKYVFDRITDCDFTDFELQGYDVYVDSGTVDSKINDLTVDVSLKNRITIFKGDSKIVVDNHELSLNSKLGKFFGMAIEIYNYERVSSFLEDYALDVMRLYAPVTGTEITCTPKIFVDENIRADIKEGLVQNIATLKLNGDYYDLTNKDRNYFVTDSGLNIDENLNFMYSKDWPTRIEIYGDKVVNPVGLQEGLGILGFCYVPYHLVYDIDFPVMVQLFDDFEMFQFPVGVVISKNQAREALPSIEGVSIESQVCSTKNQDVDIFTYDSNIDPIEARVQFKCLDSVCEIGSTAIKGSDAVLKGEIPQCVNGFIVASAEGYADGKVLISSNEETVANLVLRKKYNLSVDLGSVKSALVRFESEDYNAVILYPESKSVELIEADYNVSVTAYDSSSLKIPAVNDRKCVDVPSGGVAGFFGGETEKCFDVNIPETDVSFAVVGGGKTSWYVTEGELVNSKEVNINIPIFGLPKSLDELQKNSFLVEDSLIYVELE